MEQITCLPPYEISLVTVPLSRLTDNSRVSLLTNVFADMLDHIMVEAYGERQPLTGLAQIALKNANLLVVNPFDSAVNNLLLGQHSPSQLYLCNMGTC